ncbi:MAG: hypothetical protein KIH62_003030 [Candidatus Kerfeldbacteria bacterium]|nr:hypothetical protein [Candidatus Kerfeldbacteria bacterium]
MKIFRALIVAIPIVFFLYCAWDFFAIDGQWSIETDFSKDTHTISQLYPIGRASKAIEEDGEWRQDVLNEPVYMNVRTPQAFNRAVVSLTLDPSTQPILHVGVVTRTQPLSTQLQLLSSSVVDEALTDFHRTIDGEVTILSRDAQLTTLEAVRTSSARVVTSGVAFETPTVPACATERSSPFMLPVDLVGDHDIVLALTSADTQQITLAARTETNAQIELQDADKRTVSTATAQQGIYTLTIPATPTPALYVVSIRGAGTTAFAAVTFPTDCIAAQRFVFGEAQQSFRLFATGMRMTLTANASKAFGVYTLDSADVQLDTIGAPHVAYVDSGAGFSITHGMLTVAHNGYLSFSRATAFDPRGRTVPLDETTRLDDVDVLLLSSMPSVATTERHMVYSTMVDLTRVAGERTALQFILSAPGIATHDGVVSVYRARVDFYRDPLWTRLWNAIQRLW